VPVLFLYIFFLFIYLKAHTFLWFTTLVLLHLHVSSKNPSYKLNSFLRLIVEFIYCGENISNQQRYILFLDKSALNLFLLEMEHSHLHFVRLHCNANITDQPWMKEKTKVMFSSTHSNKFSMNTIKNGMKLLLPHHTQGTKHIEISVIYDKSLLLQEILLLPRGVLPFIIN